MLAPRHAIVLATGLLALMALPPTHAGPSVGAAIHGTGTVSAFTAYRDSGEVVEGGLYEKTLVCIDCFVNATFITTDMAVVQNGVLYPMGPGTYQFRGFQGTFSYTPRALHRVDVRFEGTGSVDPV